MNSDLTKSIRFFNTSKKKKESFNKHCDQTELINLNLIIFCYIWANIVEQYYGKYLVQVIVRNYFQNFLLILLKPTLFYQHLKIATTKIFFKKI